MSKKMPEKPRVRSGLITRYHAKNRARAEKKGMPPGALVHIGEGDQPVLISVIDFDETRVAEKRITNIPDLKEFKDSPTITWINVEGLHDTAVIAEVCGIFGVHPLFQEDIVNTAQRPKLEDAGDYIFIVLKTLNYDEKIDDIVPEQISLILGRHFLISFQEMPGDSFDPIRDRIRTGVGRVCSSGADYLAYALLDAVVDNYFSILERLSDKIELLEETVVLNPTRETLQDIHRLKTDMIFLRKSVWPLREVIRTLSSGELKLISPAVRPYLRDVYDHTIHVADTMETYRDIVSGMLDIYLSSVSARLNEVMKVLTIIATIFIPLTFVTGWYGMNFKGMPELEWKYGYPMVMVIAVSMITFMLVYFRRRKWL
jgi:magnesium transporter